MSFRCNSSATYPKALVSRRKATKSTYFPNHMCRKHRMNGNKSHQVIFKWTSEFVVRKSWGQIRLCLGYTSWHINIMLIVYKLSYNTNLTRTGIYTQQMYKIPSYMFRHSWVSSSGNAETCRR